MSGRSIPAIALWGALALTPGAAAAQRPRAPEPDADPHVRRVDQALDRGDVAAAARAYHDAYLAALGSRRWEPMVAVGDASLRLGRASGSVLDARARARRHYLAALFRARQRGALDGVLRAAEAFADLGDREVAEQSLRIAERLAARGGDPRDAARVRLFARRLSASARASLSEPLKHRAGASRPGP